MREVRHKEPRGCGERFLASLCAREELKHRPARRGRLGPIAFLAG